MSYTIYALVDSRDDELFYIGISKHAHDRLNHHKSSRNQMNHNNANRIGEIIANGGTVKMMMIEVAETRKEAEEREWYWISCYRAAGFQLTNGQKLSQDFDGDPFKAIGDCPPVPMLSPAQLKRMRCLYEKGANNIDMGMKRYLLEKGVVTEGYFSWNLALTPLGEKTIKRYETFTLSSR